MNITRRIIFAAGLSVAALTSVGTPARAEYPDHPIQMIYPFAAGGAGDTLARLFANAASQIIGQQILVINRPGAGGNIGIASVAQAKPDGYTILSVSAGFAINVSLYSNPGFDPIKDFVIVAPQSTVPNVLVVGLQSPFKTVQDLVAYAKANPGKLNFGSSGIGTGTHLAGELFKKTAQIDMVHVPYNGSGAAALDVMAGRMDMMFDSSSSSVPNITGGKVRGLAVAADKRLSEISSVPTTAEAGYSFVSSSWTGVAAPAGTPKPIVDKLYEVFSKAARDPAVLDTLTNKLGGQPMYGTPDDFLAFIKKEMDANGAIVKALNLRVE